MQKKYLWMVTVILFYGLVLTSCSNDDAVTPPPAEVEAMLNYHFSPSFVQIVSFSRSDSPFELFR